MGTRGGRNSSESCGRWERTKQAKEKRREGVGYREILLTNFVNRMMTREIGNHTVEDIDEVR